VHELLGHKELRVGMIELRVLNQDRRGVRSPAKGLARRPDER